MPRQNSDVSADATMRVRMLRRQRGLTLKALADRAELTESYLSKLERGQSVPSISVALRLAAALGVEVGALFGEEAAEDVITIVRADERTPLTPRPGGPHPGYEGIASGATGKAMLPFIVRPAPMAEGSEFREHSGDELVFVHAGTVLLQFADREVSLAIGDAAYFRGGVPHRLVQAPGSSDAQALIVIGRDPSERTDPVPPHG